MKFTLFTACRIDNDHGEIAKRRKKAISYSLMSRSMSDVIWSDDDDDVVVQLNDETFALRRSLVVRRLSFERILISFTHSNTWLTIMYYWRLSHDRSWIAIGFRSHTTFITANSQAIQRHTSQSHWNSWFEFLHSISFSTHLNHKSNVKMDFVNDLSEIFHNREAHPSIVERKKFISNVYLKGVFGFLFIFIFS